jgi:hypothetical protein
LKPGLNFMVLSMMTSRTRNILTNCGKTPAWQRPVLTASRICKLSKTPFLLTQTTILCNLIQLTNVITQVLRILDFNPSPAYKSTKPRNLPLTPMLRKRKFEFTDEPITFASIAITQTIKFRTALPRNRMTIVGATRILTCRSAASR